MTPYRFAGRTAVVTGAAGSGTPLHRAGHGLPGAAAGDGPDRRLT
ncbi:hypothetical protein CLV70_101338 [Pseudosporangium ferrugineum]|uniref:Uncharacterized protein n=1 Tax=Pseudosporangium ferrugineum TaxID=439699 RepID=A0A2T0SIC6_9ACTN|nr:hypothetical protein CLV70_101338 [Pseudosporangium ferrugineum]